MSTNSAVKYIEGAQRELAAERPFNTAFGTYGIDDEALFLASLEQLLREIAIQAEARTQGSSKDFAAPIKAIAHYRELLDNASPNCSCEHNEAAHVVAGCWANPSDPGLSACHCLHRTGFAINQDRTGVTAIVDRNLLSGR